MHPMHQAGLLFRAGLKRHLQAAGAGRLWDGELRLDTFFIRHRVALDTPVVRAMTRNFGVRAVRRARNPGSKFDDVPVFVSRRACDCPRVEKLGRRGDEPTMIWAKQHHERCACTCGIVGRTREGAADVATRLSLGLKSVTESDHIIENNGTPSDAARDFVRILLTIAD